MPVFGGPVKMIFRRSPCCPASRPQEPSERRYDVKRSECRDESSDGSVLTGSCAVEATLCVTTGRQDVRTSPSIRRADTKTGTKIAGECTRSDAEMHLWMHLFAFNLHSIRM